MVNKRSPSPLKKVFGLNIRLERIRQNLTQEELAHRIGRDQSYVSQIESASIAASLDVVDQFAKALAVTPVSLFDATFGRGATPQ